MLVLVLRDHLKLTVGRGFRIPVHEDVYNSG